MEFETHGYIKEYWVDDKSIGTIKCEKDRDKFGYYGRKTEVLSQDIVLSNRKKIKKGQEVVTMLFPICGRIKTNKK